MVGCSHHDVANADYPRKRSAATCASASELGVSLAEYVRCLVARDLARPETAIAVDRIFDLGRSGGEDIARDKDSMISEAFLSKRRKAQRR
jgi:hypothetical protein